MNINQIANELISHANEWEDVEYVGVGFLRGCLGAQTLTVIEDNRAVCIEDNDEDTCIEFSFNRKDFARFMKALNVEEEA
jgi:hypothetical protein